MSVQPRGREPHQCEQHTAASGVAIRILFSFFLAVGLETWTGCAGISQPGSLSSADKQINITIAPSIATLASDGALQFSASVSGTAQMGVTWSTSAGTISTGGLLSAPTVSSATTLTVTATSAADKGKTASASVNLTAKALYNAPTNVSPIPYPTPIPCPSNFDPGCPNGALTGAGWTYVDPGFPNTTLLRATDANTTGPSGAPHRNWGTDCGGSAEVNLFSMADDRIALCDVTGGSVFMFLSNWPVVSELYGVCILAGNPTYCTNNFEFSQVTNDLGYSVSLSCLSPCGGSSHGNLSIYQYDVSSTSNYPSLLNGKQSLVVDLSTCVTALGNLPWGTAYGGDLTVSTDDQTFSVTASTTPAQDAATYFIVWNRTSGCRVWDTNTGSVTGDWGTNGTVTNIDRFLIHNSRMGPNASWAKLAWGSCASVNCSMVGNFFWNIPTLTVTTENTISGCGHTAIGYTHIVNNCVFNPYPYQGFFIRPANLTSDYSSLPALYPATSNLTGWDQHMTWAQGLNLATDAGPFFSTTWVEYYGGYSGLPDTNAWDGELIAVSANAPAGSRDGEGGGVVYRLAHLYNSMQEPASKEFNGTYAIGACSWDGKYCAWSADWNGMFGNTNGTATSCTITAGSCRLDVVLARLP